MRRLLNLALVATIGGCVFLALLVWLFGGSANQTAQLPAPTQIALSALATAPPMEPTATPEPTTVPALTVPPEAPPVPAGAGLNVNRASLQEIYERAGFVFAVEPLNDGRERVVGTASDGALIELIGPESNLVRTSVVTPYPTGNEQQRKNSVLYITGLIGQIAPEWLDEGAQWVGAQLGKMAQDDLNATTMAGNRTVTLRTLGTSDGMLVLFTMEGP